MCCLIFYVKDEDPKNAWLYLHENDIVAILNQLQIAEVFKHVLLVTSNPDGNIWFINMSSLSLIFVYFDNVKSILIVRQVPLGMTVIKPQSLCSWNCWLSVHVLWIYSGVGSRPIIFPDINSSTRELAEWSGTQLNPLEVPTGDGWTLCTYQNTIDYRVCV